MIALRAAKVVMVAAIALFASLVAFGNLTDYNTNFVFVEHVLSMDTIFPFSTIQYRAITNPTLHQAAYASSSLPGVVIAVLCWIGAAALVRQLRAVPGVQSGEGIFPSSASCSAFCCSRSASYRSGGEWFGMWQSQQWNERTERVPLFVVTIIASADFVAMPDQELDRRGA